MEVYLGREEVGVKVGVKVGYGHQEQPNQISLISDKTSMISISPPCGRTSGGSDSQDVVTQTMENLQRT